jgi:hypothetical protein
MKEHLKEKFIEKLKEFGGIVCQACEATGISRSTFYRWRDEDPEFSEAVDEVAEAQIDFVESKLMKLINQGDTTATIFYLKTRGKRHGWNEKQQPMVEINAEPQQPTLVLPTPEEEASGKQMVAKRVKSKKAYLVKLLKEQGKYTAELSMQAQITAQLLVRTEILSEEILSDEHEAESVEISREGNERRTVSPKEKLYLDFVQQSQRALKALGMNTDSRERKSDNDSFGDFLKEFGSDEG